jgi:hypothetical protein
MVAATAAKAPISFDRNPPKLIGGDELIDIVSSSEKVTVF